MVFILQLPILAMQTDEFLEVHFDATRVGPVLGMQLACLENDGEAELRAGVDDFGR